MAALEGLTKLLADKEARPAFFAAIALGRFADPSAVAPLVAMLERNDDRDVELRHAGVMGLSGCARDEQLEAVAGASLPSVRMAALLAMRRRGMPQVARFLDDRERALVVEAARAIHDAPIPEGMEELARRLQWNGTVEPPLLARSINANFRLGGREHAQRLAQVASTRSDLPEPVRADALRALVEFDAPPARDRVLGVWRPCANGRSPAAVAVLQPHLGRMLASEGETLRELSARFVATHAVPGFSRELRALVVDSQREVATRAAALEALRATNDPELREVLGMALASESPKLRGAARDVLATIDPSTALPILAKAIEHGTTVEKQDAFATLGAMEYDPASALLCTWLEELTAGDVAPEVALDILEAAERKKSLPQNGQQGELVERLARYEAARSKEDPLAAWKECALGGEPSRGRELFFQRNDLQCLKCHRVGGEGAGESGPDLHGIGAKSPAYLLESIVLPNREIAAGFGNTVFVLKDGDVVDGRAIGETETHWIAVTADRGTVRIRKSAVASRRQGLSAMPADLVQHLSKRDLRDLVAWLGSL